MSEHQDLIGALEFAKLSYQDRIDGINVSRTSVTTLLGSASLLFAVVSVLGILDPNNARVDNPSFTAGVYILGALFTIFLLLSLSVIKPIQIDTPVKPTWETYQKYLFGKETLEAYGIQINAYHAAIEANDPKVNRFVQRAAWASYFFGAIILNLLVLFIFLS